MQLTRDKQIDKLVASYNNSISNSKSYIISISKLQHAVLANCNKIIKKVSIANVTVSVSLVR